MTALPDRLPTDQELHDHPHDHDAADEVRDPRHVEFHRSHPGWSHNHPHMPGVFDHHPKERHR